MKTTFKRLLALFCALLMLISAAAILASCEKEGDKDSDKGGDKDGKLNTSLKINISVLNGTTGFGAAKLISDTSADKSALNYKFTVETDPGNVTGGLINGSIDIAAPQPMLRLRFTTRPAARSK